MMLPNCRQLRIFSLTHEMTIERNNEPCIFFYLFIFYKGTFYPPISDFIFSRELDGSVGSPY